ncbi:MAG TPA: TetR/AcrR family transcriptional regulator [Ktedonobacterales bacterium]|nr:TetR/AcrR family transcriptional regulator [Ktedonobacterales bacterium]
MTSAIRELVRDARQTAILDAARDLFSRQGYHKTTVPEIAKAAGASVGLIYYHFDSKADILVAIVEEFHTFGLAALEGSPGATDPRERLDAAVRDLFVAFDHFSKVFVILYKDISSLRHEERQRIFALEEDTVNHVATLIQEGQRAGVFSAELHNVPLMAANLVGLGHLWALKKTWYFSSHLTLADYIDTQLLYLHGLLDVRGEANHAHDE